MKILCDSVLSTECPGVFPQQMNSVFGLCLCHIEPGLWGVPFGCVHALRQRLWAKWNVFCSSVRSDHMDFDLGTTRREIGVIADFGAEFHLPVIFQGRILR